MLERESGTVVAALTLALAGKLLPWSMGDQTLRPLGRQDPEQRYIRAGEVSSWAVTLVLLHRAFLGHFQGVTHGLIQGHGSSLLPLFLPDGLLKPGASPVYARLDDCALL
jgi:hypothetical protein